MRTSLFINELNVTIHEAIEAYAMKNDLTYREAVAETRLKINGARIRPVRLDHIVLEIGPRKYDPNPARTLPKKKARRA